MLAFTWWFVLATAASAQAGAATEQLTADAPRTTPAGATFTAPAGWALRAGPDQVVLDPPEADSHVALVDVQAKDADEAVAKAWAIYQAGAKRPLKLTEPQAPREGWEERRFYEYETSPNERAVIYAYAWRAGTQWVVAIVDATEPTFEKRGSPISLILLSLRPKGYQRESFAGRKAHPLSAERIEVLKSFVANGMRELGVPGVGLSFVDHGKPVFLGGVGIKELGKPDPVDADTLFIAASNTKALTTLLLANLVDRRKLRWDQPVSELDPTFRLGDAETTRQVLVKHLICACTGMPRQDLEWIFEYRDVTPESAIALLGTMQPTSHFGEVFQYSNLMAAAAGYIGAEIVAPKKERGAAYDMAMQSLVFAPLGMNRTTFDFARAMSGNYAKPHGDDVDGNTAVGKMDLNYSIVPLRPAGGVWTSARDLTKYVQMEIAGGKLPSGKRYVSTASLLARQAPQIMVSEDITYGMGLFVDRRWGIPVVHHGGDLAGYHSDMMWLPEYGVGAVILTNSDAGWRLRGPLMRRLVEVLFDGKPEAEEQLRITVAQRKAEIAKERERLIVPADPAEASKLAAHYVSPDLGSLRVHQQDGALAFNFTEWRSTVASRRNDDGTISFITIDPTFNGFNFVVGESDDKRTLMIRDAQHEYLFTETAEQ